MARLLVWARDEYIALGTSGDDKWKRGDVVDVKEDGQSFGNGFDGHEAFRQIEVAGVSAAQLTFARLTL